MHSVDCRVWCLDRDGFDSPSTHDLRDCPDIVIRLRNVK